MATEQVFSKDKFESDYLKLLSKLTEVKNAELTEASALKNLCAIDIRQINLHVVSADCYAWLFIPVFKRKTFCFPSPVEISPDGEVVKVDFTNYDINSFTDFCFWFGKKGEGRCNHRSCQSIYYCFKKAAQENQFYRALWLSFEKQLPRLLSSQIVSLTKSNIDYIVAEIGGRNVLVVPKEGFVYYSDKMSVCGYKLLLNEGNNVYKFFNKKVVPYTFQIDHDRYPEKAFTGQVVVKGDINIFSKYNLTNDTRLTMELYKRQLNYGVNVITLQLALFSFCIEEFKNSLYLARNETEKYVQNLLALFGAYPLLSDYKENREDKDFSQNGRKFYFLAKNDFDLKKIQATYNDTMFKLSGLVVSFSSEDKLDVIRNLDELKITLSSQIVSAPGEESMEVENGSNNIQTVETFTPLLLGTSQTFENNMPKIHDQYTYMMIKPSGNQIDNLNNIFKLLVDYDMELENVFSFQMNNAVFNALYPNCLNRVYGQDWHTYLTSAECLILRFNNTSWELVRSLSLKARLNSGLPWVKNVAHSAASQIESELMHDLFGSFFETEPLITEGEPLQKYLKLTIV